MQSCGILCQAQKDPSTVASGLEPARLWILEDRGRSPLQRDAFDCAAGQARGPFDVRFAVLLFDRCCCSCSIALLSNVRPLRAQAAYAKAAGKLKPDAMDPKEAGGRRRLLKKEMCA